MEFLSLPSSEAVGKQMAADRAVQLLLERAPLDRRLELATMDADLCHEVLSFHDVSLAIIKADGIHLANKQHQLAVVTMSAEKIGFHFGRSLSNLVVETKLPAVEWQKLLKLKLKKLFVSVENLDEMAKLPDGIKVADSRLKSLHLLQRNQLAMDHNTRFDPYKFQHFLSPSLTRICLTGLSLSEEAIQCLFSLPNLTSVDLIGTIVDTMSVKVYQHRLKPPESLEELSLPPSWFSFSTAASYHDTYYKRAFNFSTWLTVSKICLYVQNYDEDVFWSQLGQCMPNHLETLVLYGNCTALKADKKLKNLKRLKILFGPNADQLLTFNGCASTRLFSHIVKKPPYSWKRSHDMTSAWQLRITPTSEKIRQKQERLEEEEDVRTTRPIRRRRVQYVRQRRVDDAPEEENMNEPTRGVDTAREISPSADGGHQPTTGVSTARSRSRTRSSRRRRRREGRPRPDGRRAPRRRRRSSRSSSRRRRNGSGSRRRRSQRSSSASRPSTGSRSRRNPSRAPPVQRRNPQVPAAPPAEPRDPLPASTSSSMSVQGASSQRTVSSVREPPPTPNPGD